MSARDLGESFPGGEWMVQWFDADRPVVPGWVDVIRFRHASVAYDFSASANMAAKGDFRVIAVQPREMSDDKPPQKVTAPGKRFAEIMEGSVHLEPARRADMLGDLCSLLWSKLGDTGRRNAMTSAAWMGREIEKAKKERKKYGSKK